MGRAGTQARAGEEAGTLGLVVAVRPGDGLGFSLAGATVVEIPAGEEGAALREVVGDPRTGVLAIEEEVLSAAPRRVLRRARERGVPVVLPFALPRRWGDEGRGRAYVAALIRRAVGYAVKLGGGGGR